MAASQDEWVERIFREFQRDVYLVALSILRNESDAQDVVQEVFIQLARARPENMRSERAYICRMAANKSKDYLRKHRRMVSQDPQIIGELMEEGQPPDHEDFTDQYDQALQDCLNKMRTDQHDLLNRIYFLNHSRQKIAEDLGVTVNALYARTLKAKEQLENCLKQ